MAATVNYDHPHRGTRAAHTTVPPILLDAHRMNSRYSTVSGTIQFDNSYPTGGYGPMNQFGLKSVIGVFFEDVSGYGIYYNKATDKVQLFTTAGTEVTNGTNLSSLAPVYFEAKGLA